VKSKYSIIGFSAVAAVAFWFLAVDRSWFVERCPTCGHFGYIMQIRVCGIPVHEHRYETDSLLQKVAADLGVPCTHPNLKRYYKHRYWGLLICACPCINGIDSINADLSWYDAAVSARVKGMAAANPALRAQFVERVIKNRDWKYWGAFVDQMKAAKQ
jgi:hypothetical protein